MTTTENPSDMSTISDLTCSIVTIDTVSIQKYVFASNKLKENIGASHIIERWLYDQLMVQSLQAAGQDRGVHYLQEWEEMADQIRQDEKGETELPIRMFSNPKRNAEIGYIGGGTCMVLLRDETIARAFITHFSTGVMTTFPGLRVAFGQFHGASAADFAAEGDRFRKIRQMLNQSMITCRNRYFQPYLPLKPGIVKDCAASGEAAEFRIASKVPGTRPQWISGTTRARLAAAPDALRTARKNYREVLDATGFTLTNEIESLGQPQDKGYIAVVHGDGNGIGRLFMETDSLSALRVLSVRVATIATDIMGKLIAQTAHFFLGSDAERDKAFNLKDGENGLRILPIRPLLVAGDDFTFVCEGRLGIFLAAKFLEYFEQATIRTANGQTHRLKACAGVAICKTHYPFFKAYSLSEQLMDQCKKKAKQTAAETGQQSSWLYFMAVPAGFNGDLEATLAQQFAINGDALLNGPYSLGYGENDFGRITQVLRHYRRGSTAGQEGWPNNKLMELRDTFRKSTAEQARFITEMEARGLEFHETPFQFWHEREKEQVRENEQEREKETFASVAYDTLHMADFFPPMLLDYFHQNQLTT